MHPDFQFGEDDLVAFVDGELPLERRVEVEAFLARNPAIAARVMADLSLRDALRASCGGPVAVTSSNRAAAFRLVAGLRRRRGFVAMRRAASIGLLIGAGWVGHAVFLTTGVSVAADARPAFIEDAVHAYRTAVLRAELESQPEAATFDPGELAAGTGIAIPALPDGWQVRDAQVFPTRSGHSIEMIVEDAAGDRLFLFAARSGSFDVIPPSLTLTDAGRTAYWQVGETVYALSGPMPDEDMRRQAETLAASLY